MGSETEVKVWLLCIGNTEVVSEYFVFISALFFFGKASKPYRNIHDFGCKIVVFKAYVGLTFILKRNENKF